jgi:AbrB family looped-hinge helix DNA binding protein
MTTTLSSQGQMVIPAEIRQAVGLKPGDDLLVSQRPNGDIVLRKINRRPKLTLVEHLSRLKGLRTERLPEALERYHGLSVVTGNEKDFPLVPVVDPFK